jgi:N-methylhydantoinase A/oxoprolinase/acetone carboxylase beta subunit
VARQAGAGQVLSLDIGGTSADVAIIVDGTPTYGTGEMVGDFPIYIPTVSVTSIGDGGGSIAAVSEFGILTVGPESAGSTPGPACYGRGGTRPTMTDAFAVCGVIGHGNIGYDAVAVDVEEARAAVGTVAAKLGRGSNRPPKPSFKWRSPACTARSASSPRARASTRATSRCWRSAAPDRCWAASWRANWACAGC